MFRSQIAFLLILALMSSNFNRFFIFAGFELNKDYISTTLCENRNMPEMNCNGQCYLSKKIKQAQEKEKKNNQELKKNSFQEALLTEKVTLATPLYEYLDFSITEIPFNLPVKSTSIFHPPKVYFISFLG